MTAPTHFALQPMTGQACQWMKNRQRRYGHTCAAGHSRLSVVLLDASRTLLFSNSLLKTGIFLTSAHEYNRVAWSQVFIFESHTLNGPCCIICTEFSISTKISVLVHIIAQAVFCVHRYANLSIAHYTTATASKKYPAGIHQTHRTSKYCERMSM